MTTTIDLQSMKERLAEKFDPDYLVDILRLSSMEILDAFEDRLIEMIEEWECDVEDPE